MFANASPILVAVLSAVIGLIGGLTVAILGHRFTANRDLENKRREKRIDYLVAVFRTLCKASHHPNLSEINAEVEQAIADVQLFGTPSQVSLAQKFSLELAASGGASLDEILEALRSDLRAELGAEKVGGSLIFLKIRKRGK
jgi:hypothetical protein